MKQNLISDNP